MGRLLSPTPLPPSGITRLLLLVVALVVQLDEWIVRWSRREEEVLSPFSSLFLCSL
jgi:hypothetical protein